MFSDQLRIRVSLCSLTRCASGLVCDQSSNVAKERAGARLLFKYFLNLKVIFSELWSDTCAAQKLTTQTSRFHHLIHLHLPLRSARIQKRQRVESGSKLQTKATHYCTQMMFCSIMRTEMRVHIGKKHL